MRARARKDGALYRQQRGILRCAQDDKNCAQDDNVKNQTYKQ